MLRTRPPGITSPSVRGLTLVTLDMGFVPPYRVGMQVWMLHRLRTGMRQP